MEGEREREREGGREGGREILKKNPYSLATIHTIHTDLQVLYTSQP